MRLKRLKIFGFKSFAKAVSLEFHEGITAIVGPNGCGKSNIVDAFRWVLGEQSAKSIRGDKMVDVIFSGTSSRKPLNLAEVALSFTNEDGKLPIDYNEVDICRKVFRSGESEFYINNNQVRLKDIDSLFWDTGVGKDAYCIFEQGKIEEIITSSPMERRAIFEEPAGINRFKMRKKETLRKLDQVDVNLSRAKDIASEVTKQRETAEQQAAEAKLYKQNKQSLELVEKALFVAKIDCHTQKFNAANERLEQLKNSLDQKETEKSSTELLLTCLKEELAVKEMGVEELGQGVHTAKSALECARLENANNIEKTAKNAQRVQKINEDISFIETRRGSGLKEVEEQKEHFADIDERCQKAKEIFLQAQEQMQKAQNSVNAMRDTVKKAADERLLSVQRENSVLAQLREVRFTNERLDERQSKLVDQKKVLADRLVILDQTEKERQKSVIDLSGESQTKKQELAALEDTLAVLQKDLIKIQEEHKALFQMRSEGLGREKALLKLKEEMEGMTVGTKRLLQEAKKASSPLHKKIRPLYEMVDAIDDKRQAFATALLPYTQTLVVETIEDAQIVFAFAEQHKLKDFSVFCLNHVDDKKVATPQLGHALLAKKEGSKLLRHFAHGVEVVNALRQEWQRGKAMGDLLIDENQGYVDNKNVYFLSSRVESNAFSRESELKSLLTQLQELAEQILEKEKNIETITHKRNEGHNRRLELDKAHRLQEMRLVEANFHLQQTLSEKEKNKKDQERLIAEEVQLKTERAKTQDLVAAAEKKAKEANISRESANENFIKLEKELEVLVKDQADKEGDYRTKSHDYRRLEEDRQSFLSKQRIFKAKDEENEREQKRLKEELLALTQELTALSEEKDRLQHHLRQCEEQFKTKDISYQALRSAYLAEKEKLEETEKEIASKQAGFKEESTAFHKCELAKVQETTTLEALKKALIEQYQLEYEVAKEELGEINEEIDVLEKRLRSFRKEIEKAGNINLASIEEYDRLKEREQFLDQQIGDLTTSKDELLHIINELDRESRGLFAEVFAKIRANFKKNFQLLFQGGEADLTLTESDDLLEAGIEISAKPPGKQMRAITLLSGGEKCLTAMALLFAIFEVKPSAFCILDEVDAPLDETNVDRLTNMLRQFVEKTQFIVITHNKRTMAVADRLFGISMEEKGVSQVLSLELQSAESLVEVH
ncbi:MAG: chromosome segregation protein SMC [Parachlamydiales bacterium]|nr:chromosome segregation protein SMC [Parachlamydiales bacterium]